MEGVEAMTNDLISREALKDKFVAMREYAQTFMFKTIFGDLIEVIEREPAVDAAPVVHAKWHLCRMNVPKGHGQMYSAWRCSACHKHERKRSDYCPNCGAKMDK